MTRNQIEFAKLEEQRRSNLRQEALTHYRDSSTITLRGGELSETMRHNQVVESQALADLGIKQQQADSSRITAEANRQNAQTREYEAVSGRMTAEANTRNAKTREYEAISGRMTAEANQRNAATNAYNADINKMNADINAYNASTNRINAGANVTQAAASAYNAQTNRLSQQSQADVNQAKIVEAQSQTDLNLSRVNESASTIDLNRARKEQIETQTGYLGQENTREWIGTITQGISSLARAAETGARTFKQISGFGGPR